MTIRETPREQIMDKWKMGLTPVLAVVLAVGSCGCASTAKRPLSQHEIFARQCNPPPTGWGGLYFYRGGGAGGRGTWTCWVDGQHAGEIGSGEFLYRMVRPGYHTIQCQAGGKTLDPYSVEIEKGENAFLRGLGEDRMGDYSMFGVAGVLVAGVAGNRYRLEQTWSDEGAVDIGKLRLAGDSESRDKDLKDADYGPGKGSSPVPCGTEDDAAAGDNGGN